MYRLARLHLHLPLPRPPTRLSRAALSTSLPHLKTPSSQGHATRKSSDPTHKDKDVQSASVTAAKQSKSASQAGNSSGSDQPFDAARQGGSGGESKSGSEGSGPGQGWEGSMKDQVGGQSGGGSKKGGKEGAAGDSITETIANKVRGLHTSARLRWPTTPGSLPDGKVEGNAQPVEDLHGEQNEHLKHKPADEVDKGAGNAAADPHLPSEQKKEGNAVNGSKSQKKGLHTSAVARSTKPPGGYAKAVDSEPKTTSGYNVPQEALPQQLDSAYGKDAAPPAEEDMIPSSDVPHSSTAVDPPNETLREQAMSGGLKDRNPQPQSEFGRQGNAEAWKKRGI